MCAVTRCSNLGILGLIVASLVVFPAARAASQTAITACGQEVKGDAYLVGDLDCPEETEAAVTIQNGHLDMRGFTIRGGEYGVFCAKETGEIGTATGEEIYKYVNCSVSNGTIVDQTELGVDASKLKLTDVTIAPAGGFAIIASKELRFANVTVQLPAGGRGIVGNGRIDGSNLTITGGRLGIAFAKKVSIKGMTMSGMTAYGVTGSTIRLENASVTDCGSNGIEGDKVRIIDSVVTGHSEVGVRAVRLRTAGSTVTGNGTDLFSVHRPKVVTTTCDTSNWGVCAND